MLAGVLGSWEAGRVHSVESLIRLKNICSNIRPCASDDGRNGARNILS